MIKILKPLSETLNAYVILQTGKKNFDEVCAELNSIYPEYKENKNILVAPYFDEMVYSLKASDVVIARAGSVSLTEILQCNLPSILVPYPYAAQDHQRKNAREMTNKGVSLYLEDADCNENNLLNMISQIITDKQTLNTMRDNISKLTKTNPADEIVKQLKSIMQ